MRSRILYLAQITHTRHLVYSEIIRIERPRSLVSALDGLSVAHSTSKRRPHNSCGSSVVEFAVTVHEQTGRPLTSIGTFTYLIFFQLVRIVLLSKDSVTLILLAAPSVGPTESSTCVRLLLDGVTTRPNVLHIDYIQSPPERRRQWDEMRTEISDLSVVNVETQTRSTAGQSPTGADGESMTVETVSPPESFTQLGMGITKCLDRWDDDDAETRVCFHSLSALLHYTDVSSAFKFLNVLRTQLGNRGAIGHVHIDPEAHDEMVLNRLKPLFDAYVQVDLDGSVDVTSC
ncbi:MAG: DUF7504 family protein [Halobacteriota archaeon]